MLRFRASAARLHKAHPFTQALPSNTSTDSLLPTAKRAYLTLLSSPPPALRPADDCTPKLNPYTGSDVSAILTAVQNRPRSRSNATSMVGGHSRKGSLLGSGGAGVGAPPGIGAHARKASYGREGGQRLSWGGENGEAPPVPALPEGFEEAEGGSPVAIGEAGRRMVNAALGRSSNGGMTKSGTSRVFTEGGQR